MRFSAIANPKLLPRVTRAAYKLEQSITGQNTYSSAICIYFRVQTSKAIIGGGSTLKVGGQNDFPSLSPPLTFSPPLSPSPFPSLSLSSPPLPLEVGPLNAARGLGCAISSLVGSGAQPQPTKDLMHIEGHNKSLGITFLPVLRRRKFNILHTEQAHTTIHCVRISDFLF